MGIKTKLLIVSTLVLSTSANAALISRLGGAAYYDNVNDLTWLANASVNGVQTWANANTWAAGLDVAGVTGWRLPDTIQPDASCASTGGNGQSRGLNCTGSELGNLFYNVLGGVAISSITTTHNANYDLFSGVQSSLYWSATEYAPNTSSAWFFNMSDGFQSEDVKSFNFYSWAVQSGDVSAVPVPAAVWLFGSGLLGLIGVARRKKV